MHLARILGSTALLSLVLPLASCGSEVSGLRYEDLVTELDPATIEAGASARVLCSVKRGAAWIAPDEFAATISPEPPVPFDTGASIASDAGTLLATANRAGTYRVSCQVPKYEATDPVGALLTVVSGTPVAARPVFGSNPVEAGTPTSLTCVSVDAFGNESPLTDADFDLPEGLTPSGADVTATTAGLYEVTCGKGSLTRTPSTLEVLAGDPARVELTATPERPAYSTGAVVTLAWTVYDRFDNAIPELDATITPPTSPGFTVVDADAHKFRLDEEGRYRFTVRLDPPAAPLTDDLELLVDVTPPEILLEFPPRGATLHADDGPVVVRGRILDAGGLPADALIINGESAPVANDGRFSHEVDSVWGINILKIGAADLAGNVSDKSPSYAYSDGWLGFIDQDARGLQQPDGLVVLLGQNFFDDGIQDPAKLDDIATLVAVLLGSLDIQTPLEQALSALNQTIPLFEQEQRTDIIQNISWLEQTLTGNLAVSLSSAETTGWGPIDVDIDSRPGGLDFDIDIGDDTRPAFSLDLVFRVTLTFNVAASACSPLGCLPLPDSTTTAEAVVTSSLALGDFDIILRVDASKTYQQPMQLSIVELTSTVGNFALQPIDDVTLNINIPGVAGQPGTSFSLPLSQFIDLGAIFGSILDPIADAGGSLITGALNPLIQGFTGPILSGLFDLLVVDTVLPLPNLLGGAPVDLGFSTELSTVDFTDDGGTIGLATGLHTEKGIDFDTLGREGDPHEEDPEGAILRGDCLGNASPDLEWNWNPSVGIGVRVDVLNSAFYAIWWSGALNAPLDLSALGGAGGGIPIPIDGLSVELEWLLPPVINDCSKGGLEVQLGDLFVTLRGEVFGSPIAVEMYADLSLALAFVSRDGTDGSAPGLYLSIGQITDSDIEIASLDDAGLGEIFDIGAILESLPQLLGGFLVGQEIGPFTLPATDLSTVAPTLPPGTTLGLGNLQVRSASGYAVIGGDLE